MLNLQNIDDAKRRLESYNPVTFNNIDDSYRFFTNKISIDNFRHVKDLEITFDQPVTIISGTNKIGKTSILLLLACSHYNFLRYDSTKPETLLRRHTWGDVLPFTNHENTTKDYSYKLFWRLGSSNREGEAKRLHTSQAWTGVGKASSDINRVNAQIRDREVRLIDLERILPARNFSSSLLRKISTGLSVRVNVEIEQAFAYILELPANIEIYRIGSHINKTAFLICYTDEPYSSYNAASGEESLLNILHDIFEAEKDSLILIDELEAGLHPLIQRRLADIIQYVSWLHKKQFILTTHSPTLMSAFNSKSRKFIECKDNGSFNTINNISMNAAFSKMDSFAHPLVYIYCEDDLAKFIIKSMLITINQQFKYFDRLVNIIKSGPINQVKNDYESHKRIYEQMVIKIGYSCVFDGDHISHPSFSNYYSNPEEHSFFIYPHKAPEVFLVEAFLKTKHSNKIESALSLTDHHSLFHEITNEGFATDPTSARNMCWNLFTNTSEYKKLFNDFYNYIINTVKYFSEKN